MKKGLSFVLATIFASQFATLAENSMAFSPQRFPASFTTVAPTAQTTGPNLLTNPPDGEERFYNKLSQGYLIEWTTFREHSTDCGANIIFTESGEVYFANFLSNLVTPAWIKGTLSEDGKTIHVDFPQDYIIVPNTENWGSLNRGNVIYNQETNFIECVIDTENNYVDFSIDEDGSIEMEDGAEIVLVWDDATFSGYADNVQEYYPIDPPLRIPENVDTKEWAFLYGIEGGFVEIGENDDTIFIKGLSSLFPETAISGNIQEDIIEIESSQFIGIYETHLTYLMFAIIDSTGQIILENPNDKFIMKYDRENHTIIPVDQDIIWLINASTTEVRYVEAFSNPTFKYQGVISPAPPRTPELSYYDDSMFDEFGESYLWFGLPPFNVNGDVIHTDNYYYTIYIDDEPYTLYGDLYPVLGEMGITEITDIPYNMSLGSGLAVMGMHHGIVILAGYMDKIGIQSYIIEDGIEYRSDMMTLDLTNVGVESIEKSNNILNSEYYDITGKKVNANTRGLLIRKDLMSDKSVKITKILN